MKRMLLFGLVVALCLGSTLQAQQISTGAITFDEDVVIAQPPPNQGSLIAQIAGTWAATLTFEGSVDGTNYVVLTVSNVTTAAAVTTTTANGVFSVSGSGLRFFRVRASAYSSGQADVTIAAGPGGGAGGSGGGGGGGSVTQGTDPWVVGQATAANLNATVVGTGTFAVQAAQATAANLNATVTGGLANDGVAAGTNRVATLPGLVETSAPTRTNGRNAGFSFLAGGGARMVIVNDAGASQTLATDAVFGTATYTEATTTGPVMGAVRTDTPAALVNTTNEIGPLATSALGGLYTASASDPCSRGAKTYYVVNLAAAATVEIANAVASQFFYICSVNLVTAGAGAVLIAEDDTDGCGSLSAGLNGGTTAATGWTFAANGGIALGNGLGTVLKTTTANRYLCIAPSGTGQLSGSISYVSAP